MVQVLPDQYIPGSASIIRVGFGFSVCMQVIKGFSLQVRSEIYHPASIAEALQVLHASLTPFFDQQMAQLIYR
jgi:hypothetical protein